MPPISMRRVRSVKSMTRAAGKLIKIGENQLVVMMMISFMKMMMMILFLMIMINLI